MAVTKSLLLFLLFTSFSQVSRSENGQTLNSINNINDQESETRTMLRKVTIPQPLETPVLKTTTTRLANILTRAFGGGKSGATAGMVQVLSMMWLRTIMNYQVCKHGHAISHLFVCFPTPLLDDDMCLFIVFSIAMDLPPSKQANAFMLKGVLQGFTKVYHLPSFRGLSQGLISLSLFYVAAVLFAQINIHICCST
jgi:hypothetical protein